MAPARRQMKPRDIVRSPRSSVTQVDHTNIDSLLKNLRASQRLIRSATKAQSEELIILERLYYKSNNQHRSSMMWRKMAEMRRIGRRLSEVDLPAVIESLRRGFYSEDAVTSNGNKSLKGAWTHVPDVQFMACLYKRIAQIDQLLTKAREVYLKCYNTFALSMQDTSFITLSASLMSISARLHGLAQECQDALSIVSISVSSLIGIFDPTRSTEILLRHRI